ncbi:MAG: hypothetical protein I3273_00455 [Candidatus Moeniiplasma glomeromycotorum]|nr:hypothetical protein [Candidatus Moeniiplasma glomeromycotorum]MCE8167403.1 hypothetical protein [Candidatus Moeniiplasma glomeromycotorum]MCE8168583.1 hypothetical protein [Candidatus Moeniiplasma glomeromycotorum]
MTLKQVSKKKKKTGSPSSQSDHEEINSEAEGTSSVSSPEVPSHLLQPTELPVENLPPQPDRSTKLEASLNEFSEQLAVQLLNLLNPANPNNPSINFSPEELALFSSDYLTIQEKINQEIKLINLTYSKRETFFQEEINALNEKIEDINTEFGNRIKTLTDQLEREIKFTGKYKELEKEKFLLEDEKTKLENELKNKSNLVVIEYREKNFKLTKKVKNLEDDLKTSESQLKKLNQETIDYQRRINSNSAKFREKEEKYQLEINQLKTANQSHQNQLINNLHRIQNLQISNTGFQNKVKNLETQLARAVAPAAPSAPPVPYLEYSSEDERGQRQTKQITVEEYKKVLDEKEVFKNNWEHEKEKNRAQKRLSLSFRRRSGSFGSLVSTPSPIVGENLGRWENALKRISSGIIFSSDPETLPEASRNDYFSAISPATGISDESGRRRNSRASKGSGSSGHPSQGSSSENNFSPRIDTGQVEDLRQEMELKETEFNLLVGEQSLQIQSLKKRLADASEKLVRALEEAETLKADRPDYIPLLTSILTNWAAYLSQLTQLQTDLKSAESNLENPTEIAPSSLSELTLSQQQKIKKMVELLNSVVEKAQTDWNDVRQTLGEAIDLASTWSEVALLAERTEVSDSEIDSDDYVAMFGAGLSEVLHTLKAVMEDSTQAVANPRYLSVAATAETPAVRSIAQLTTINEVQARLTDHIVAETNEIFHDNLIIDEKFNNHRDKIVEEIEDLNTVIAEGEGKLRSIQAEIDEEEAKITTQRKDYSTLETELKKAGELDESKVYELTKLKESSDQVINQITDKLNKLREKYTRISKRLVNFRNKAEKGKIILTGVADLENEVGRIMSNTNKLRDELKEKKKEKEKEKVLDWLDNLSETSELSEELNRMAKDWEGKTYWTPNEIKELKNTLIKYSNKLCRLLSIRKRQDDKITRLTNQIQQGQTDSAKLTTQIKDFQKQLNKVKAEKEDLILKSWNWEHTINRTKNKIGNHKHSWSGSEISDYSGTENEAITGGSLNKEKLITDYMKGLEDENSDLKKQLTDQKKALEEDFRTRKGNVTKFYENRNEKYRVALKKLLLAADLSDLETQVENKLTDEQEIWEELEQLKKSLKNKEKSESKPETSSTDQNNPQPPTQWGYNPFHYLKKHSGSLISLGLGLTAGSSYEKWNQGSANSLAVNQAPSQTNSIVPKSFSAPETELTNSEPAFYSQVIKSRAENWKNLAKEKQQKLKEVKKKRKQVQTDLQTWTDNFGGKNASQVAEKLAQAEQGVEEMKGEMEFLEKKIEEMIVEQVKEVVKLQGELIKREIAGEEKQELVEEQKNNLDNLSKKLKQTEEKLEGWKDTLQKIKGEKDKKIRELEQKLVEQKEKWEGVIKGNDFYYRTWINPRDKKTILAQAKKLGVEFKQADIEEAIRQKEEVWKKDYQQLNDTKNNLIVDKRRLTKLLKQDDNQIRQIGKELSEVGENYKELQVENANLRDNSVARVAKIATLTEEVNQLSQRPNITSSEYNQLLTNQKPANLSANWETELARLPDLENANRKLRTNLVELEAAQGKLTIQLNDVETKLNAWAKVFGSQTPSEVKSTLINLQSGLEKTKGLNTELELIRQSWEMARSGTQRQLFQEQVSHQKTKQERDIFSSASEQKQNELEAAQTEKETLTIQLKNLDREKTTLTNQLATANNALGEQKDLINSLSSKNIELKSSLSNLKLTQEEVQKQFQAERNLRQQAERVQEENRVKYQQERIKYEKISTELEVIQAHYTRIQNELTSEQTAHTRTHQERNTYQKENEKKQIELAEIKDKLNKTTRQLTIHRGQIAELEGQKGKLEKDLVSWTKNFPHQSAKKVANRISSLEEELTELKEVKEQLINDLLEEQGNFERIRKELQKEKVAHQQAARTSQQKQAKLVAEKNSHSQTKTELAQISEQLKQTKTNFDLISERLQKEQNLHQKAKENQQKTQTELDRIKVKEQANKNKLSETISQLKESQDQVEKLKGQKNEVEKKNFKLLANTKLDEKSIRKLTHDLEKSNRDLREIRATNQVQQGRIGELENNLLKEGKEKARQAETIRSLENEIEIQITKYQDLSTTKNGLEVEIGNLQKRPTQLQLDEATEEAWKTENIRLTKYYQGWKSPEQVIELEKTLNATFAESKNQLEKEKQALLEKLNQRPNITLTEWNHDYSLRPTRKELTDKQNELEKLADQINLVNQDLLGLKDSSRFEIARLKSENKNYQRQRDSRPDISWDDYQKLLFAETDSVLTNRNLSKSLEMAQDRIIKLEQELNQGSVQIKNLQTQLENQELTFEKTKFQLATEWDNRPNITWEKYQALLKDLEQAQSTKNCLSEVVDKLTEPGRARKIFEWIQEQHQEHPLRSFGSDALLVWLSKKGYDKMRNIPRVKELETEKIILEKKLEEVAELSGKLENLQEQLAEQKTQLTTARQNIKELEVTITKAQNHLKVADLTRLPALPEGKSLEELINFLNNPPATCSETSHRQLEQTVLEQLNSRLELGLKEPTLDQMINCLTELLRKPDSKPTPSPRQAPTIIKGEELEVIKQTDLYFLEKVLNVSLSADIQAQIKTAANYPELAKIKEILVQEKIGQQNQINQLLRTEKERLNQWRRGLITLLILKGLLIGALVVKLVKVVGEKKQVKVKKLK